MQDELGIGQISLLPVLDMSTDESADSESDSDDTVYSGIWHTGPVPNAARLAAANDAFSSDDSF
jgi:hypothetical protein